MTGSMREIVTALAAKWGVDGKEAVDRVLAGIGRLFAKEAKKPKRRNLDLQYGAEELPAAECRLLALPSPAFELKRPGCEPVIVFPATYRDKDRRERKTVCVTSRKQREPQQRFEVSQPTANFKAPAAPSLFDDPEAVEERE